MISRIIFGNKFEEPYGHTIRTNRRHRKRALTIANLSIGMIGALVIITVGTYIRHLKNRPPFEITELVCLSLLMLVIAVFSVYAELLQNRMLWVKKSKIKIWDGNFGNRIIKWPDVTDVRWKVHGSVVRISVRTKTYCFSMVTHASKEVMIQLLELDELVHQQSKLLI